MSDKNNDEKTTVVINIEDINKQKKKSEQDLASDVDALEFALPNMDQSLSMGIKIILFDFKSDFFHLSFGDFPAGYDYHLIRELAELNQTLSLKVPQVLVLNYDHNPKIVNNLSSQIKKKFSHIKTLIIAKKISPEKAKLHARSPAGADGYYELPVNQERFIIEIERILKILEKAS